VAKLGIRSTTGRTTASSASCAEAHVRMLISGMGASVMLAEEHGIITMFGMDLIASNAT